MKVLVTGGAGFIGSHLCEKLFMQGHKVYSLDNYFTGSRVNHIEGVEYIRGYTKDIDKLGLEGLDIIYHLGEYSRVEQSHEDISKVVEFNKIGTLRVLEYARRNNIKIIYAGSSTKFGDLDIYSSPYAWSKATNTDLVNDYGKMYNLDYAIVYFYNVYGPREISHGKYATLIGLFKDKTLRGEELTVVSPGTQERNFTHVYDIVEGLMMVGEMGYGDGYGIGNPKSYTVIEVAEMYGGDIKMLPERKGNRMSAQVVTEKTEALGWKPVKDLETYIKDLK